MSLQESRSFPSAPPSAQRLGTSAERFEIALGTSPSRRAGETRSRTARSFKAHGAILFDGAGVHLVALETGLLGGVSETDLRFSRADVRDVVVDGRVVSFDVAPPAREPRTLVLRARSRTEARALAARLPAITTPAFAAEAAALDRYLDGIEARAGHARVTWALVALNLLVYLAMLATGGGFPNTGAATALAFGSNFGPDTLGGQWWRLVTALFVHWSVLHLVFNMAALALAGRVVERLYGHARFAALYLCAGVVASLASLCWHATLDSAGASGAIFGVLGALVAHALRYPSSLPRAHLRQRLAMALTVVGYGLFNGLRAQRIDHAAHIGGLLAGFALGWVLARPFDEREQHGRDPHDALYLATGLAAFACAALWLQAVRANASFEARAELTFAAVMQQDAFDEQRAVDDLRGIVQPAGSVGRPGQLATRIRNDVWPEWHALRTRLAAAALPPGSPRTAWRDARLRYYDDMERSMLGFADLASLRDKPAAAVADRIRVLIADAERERAAADRALAAP
ncbi:rhomboid family intramembrane serine protease [Paraburkholderia sp. B3]|uniref:rhomboid family intramembrane serine protease n=1 Tax=Paraburkholderia sp. B3 TaxID=3134791 RepID=UPI00398239C4